MFGKGMFGKGNVGPQIPRNKFASVGLGCLTLALALGGCNSVPQAEFDRAVAENEELRQRRDTLAGALERSEEDKIRLQDQIDSLESDNARLASEVNNRPSTPNAPAGFEIRGSDAVATVAGDVLFASGQAEVTNAGKRELDRVANTIQSRYPGALLRVEGYTDSDPIRKSGWKTNERLSAERAMAVEAYLVTRGINNERIYSAAFGSARQKGSKEASRRVEIVVLNVAG